MPGALIQKNAMSSGSHTTRFAGLHEVESYGPFGFLNPTIRRLKLNNNTETPESHAGRDTSPSSGDKNEDGKGEEYTPSSTKNTELRDKDVQREFRSRDNRKG